MRTMIGVCVCACSLAAAGAGLAAHHAFSADYDEDTMVTVTGTVTKIEWMNPHARFFVDVVNDDQTVTNWSFELASPNSLTREGWGRHTLSAGDEVTVTGYAAKSGSNMASTRAVTLPGGRALFSGTQGIE